MSTVKTFYFQGGKATWKKFTPDSRDGRAVFFSNRTYEFFNREFESAVKNRGYHLTFQSYPRILLPKCGVNFCGVAFPHYNKKFLLRKFLCTMRIS